MSTHTPGPWTLNPVNGIPMVGIDVHDGGDLLPIVDTVQGRTKSVALANARLIAAAPQLAEALQFIDAELTEYLDAMPKDDTSRRLRDRARAALITAGIRRDE